MTNAANTVKNFLINLWITIVTELKILYLVRIDYSLAKKYPFYADVFTYKERSKPYGLLLSDKYLNWVSMKIPISSDFIF